MAFTNGALCWVIDRVGISTVISMYGSDVAANTSDGEAGPIPNANIIATRVKVGMRIFLTA